MRALALVLGLTAAGFLSVGCGRSALEVAKSGDSAGYAPSGAPAESMAPATPPAAAPAYAKSSSANGSSASASPAGASIEAERSVVDSSRSRADEARERPGLGTQWGETRTSRIHEVAFERQSSEPASVVALNYNDREGVSALASFRDARPIRSGALSAMDGAIKVTIEDGSGSPLDMRRVGDRNVVVGKAGQRYTIVLSNRTDRRFEAVASVDGLDVMSGETASFDQRGYVLVPHGVVRIDGFRKSEREVAAFRFSKVADSYAAETSTARNVGVIGVAFFREEGDQVSPWMERELELRDSATPFPSERRFARPPR